jgi:cell division protein FtsQ
VTGPSGTFRDGEVSPREAAGDSPTSGINAVPDHAAVLDASAPSGGRPSPRPRARTPKRRREWRAAFFALVLAGIVAAAAWVLFGSRLLVVRSVVVTGTHLVPRSEVLAVAGVEPGTPLIRVNTAQVAARIETIRQVQGAQVTRSWPDRVVIAVRERTPAMALPAPGGGYDLVDADGVVVQWAAGRPADLPLYPAAAPVASLRGDPDLAAAAVVLGELPARLRHSVDSVTAPSPDQVTLRLAGGITVLWGGTDRAGAKAEELTVLMRTHGNYYDVSAQGTVLTK